MKPYRKILAKRTWMSQLLLSLWFVWSGTMVLLMLFRPMWALFLLMHSIGAGAIAVVVFGIFGIIDLVFDSN